MTATVSTEAVIAALHHQADLDDISAGIRAAAELLLWHDLWPHRADFHQHAISLDDDGEAHMSWHHAREAFDHDAFVKASTSELAVLDLAIALATDRFRFNILGNAHAAAVLRAVTTALPQASCVAGPRP